MFKNYLKIAWRNIKRNKLHSFIHITGLAVAFSICILLFLVAYFHLSYDSFHKEKDQLFRTSRFVNNAQGPEVSSQMPLPAAAALEAEIPEIETAVTVHRAMPENFSYGDINMERLITRTDPDFFEIFNFPVIKGNSATILSGMHNIALSESTANAIFGETDPIGKDLKIGKPGQEQIYSVSAVLKDPPKNSSIHFDAVTRIETLYGYAENKNNWASNASNVFVKIAKNHGPGIVENKLVSFVEKYYPEQLAQLKSEHSEAMETLELLKVHLTNIEDVHFSGERSASIALVYAIMALGAFILLIACFNFVNLNMAQSFKRSRELGVRKTLGAFKGQLFLQLWGEAFLLYFFGFIMGMGLAYQLVPAFSAQFGGGIEIATLFQPAFLVIMLIVFIVVTLIAGGYPALKMANFGLVEILKGNVSTKKPGALRNTLLVSQFAISSLLICVSWIASQQLDFLREIPIGFEREQVISIPVGYQEDGRTVLARMRNELAEDPNIISIAGAGGNLGRGRDRTTSTSITGLDYNQNQISAYSLLADFDYLKTLQIPIIKGRDFDPNFATDTINAVVVTESFAKAMGESDPIGKYLGGEGADQIIGMVPDFNAYSPSEKELPILIHLSNDETINYIFLKVGTNDPQVVMERLESVWEKVAPRSLFNASFLDENLQAWYEMESTLTRVFGIASAIAIFLSCMGLFAISMLVIELRTKEIGIRKVMGASVNEIVSMISLHFLKLVLISLLIAMPLAWYAMQNWIQNYEYRIAINPLTFIGVGLIVAVIALVTVSFHSIKAGNANPVKSLRTE
ncbi:ABC transporter permease [Kriegella aquimaris]|uniref:ABC-type antimicrobial peptide transport system, permease component n=1 Tax=Kriegella aquimaris TaxID=192904 RepID=A0A1G9LJD0_9FLAO|nr:ABC transporter permease [Kriegella aquimaris]SDL62000.1 ABC-type antimicrobial peptide transport system, permease component [Kriegella aquimaris]